VTDDLHLAWLDVVATAGSTLPRGIIADHGERLLRRWREPHRNHHDLGHLRAVLDGLDELAAPGRPPTAVRLAAWFHDAVYRGRPGEDERASAALAASTLTELGIGEAITAEVVRLVLLTLDHVVANGDGDGALLVDADLAILAADSERYARYAEAVRAEYAHVDDSAFAAGRSSVLAGLLDRPALFRTETGRRRWERAARANLRAELALLSGSTGGG
jgi:predicted metal-dependent HD superfamily phosphohydrolase